MWLTAPNRIGIFAWQIDDSIWRFETRQGGAEGISMTLGDTPFALVGSEDRPLPPLDEQFVRGDELHLSFPQVDETFDFGFRLVLRPVDVDAIGNDATTVVFEWLVSIQTSRLDSHPTLDLITPSSEPVVVDTPPTDCGDAIGYVAGRDRSTTAVFLGRHDAPFTSRVEQAGQLRLRLFGEFLEKGVIRRARPWVFADRSANPLQTGSCESIHRALAGSPIPLD